MLYILGDLLCIGLAANIVIFFLFSILRESEDSTPVSFRLSHFFFFLL